MLVLLLLLDHIRSNPIRRNASRSLEWERYRRLGVSSVFRVDDEAPSVHWGYTTIRYLHSMCAGQCSRWTVGNRWDQHHQLHVNNKRPAKWFGINRSAALATETACGRQTARVRCALHRRFRWSAVQQRGDSVRLGYRSRSCPINGKSPRRLQHYRRIPEYAFFVQMGSIGGVRFVCQTKARFVLIIQKKHCSNREFIYIYIQKSYSDRSNPLIQMYSSDPSTCIRWHRSHVTAVPGTFRSLPQAEWSMPSAANKVRRDFRRWRECWAVTAKWDTHWMGSWANSIGTLGIWFITCWVKGRKGIRCAVSRCFLLWSTFSRRLRKNRTMSRSTRRGRVELSCSRLWNERNEIREVSETIEFRVMYTIVWNNDKCVFWEVTN